MDDATFEALNECYDLLRLLHERERLVVRRAHRNGMQAMADALGRARSVLEPEWAARRTRA